MLQLLVGAAVAGSTGFIAKHIFGYNASSPVSEQPLNCSDNQTQGDETGRDPVDETRMGLVQNSFIDPGCDSKYEEQKQDGIFRFSSPESSGKKGFRDGPKSSRKIVSKKSEKGSSGIDVSRRRFAVCLKKRRIAKNVVCKSGSCSSSSKDSSVFGWGFGVGIMYMMQAGKAEISKLNSAMDETAKAVQELKTEVCRRKSSCSMLASKSANDIATSSKKFTSKHGTGNNCLNDIKLSGVPTLDGEYASSVLTEEPSPEPEDLGMNQLEAELEFELQKLSGTDASAEGFNEPMGQSYDASQCQGVTPSELDQKLCHLLIRQQDNQIVELESELHSAQSKLNEKEAELQALKDCVRRLTEFSLSAVSDGEAEAQEEQEYTNTNDHHIKLGSESRKSLVGTKRPIDS